MNPGQDQGIEQGVRPEWRTQEELDVRMPGGEIRARRGQVALEVHPGGQQERDNLMKLSKLSQFKPSTNAQLIPIRQLELFKERNKFEADTALSAGERQLKLAEIDRKLSELGAH